MSVEIAPIAHFDGKGLPEAIVVYRAQLNPDTGAAVYYTRQFNQETPQQEPTVAMTIQQAEGSPTLINSFEAQPGTRILPKHRAMLAHAALYGPSLAVREEDVQTQHTYEELGEITHTLKVAEISRTRYLPSEQ
jgi:hypothetical protein